MQRIERRPQFDLRIDVKDDHFLETARDGQRNWLVTRTMQELGDDFEHVDRVARRFVDGSERKRIVDDWARSQARYDDSQLIIDGQQVMQDWERPYMEQMARVVTAGHGDVLEIGFGMGISASYIQAMGVRSYTVIECNEDVAARFEEWKLRHGGGDIRLVLGKWQDTIDTLGLFDGIFFDTYPLSEEEFTQYVVRDVTFAQHFFEAAARHLRDGGVFTYYSNEIDSLSRRHQRAVLQHFRELSFTVCRPLFPPADCNYWWADSMVVTRAVK